VPVDGHRLNLGMGGRFGRRLFTGHTTHHGDHVVTKRRDGAVASNGKRIATSAVVAIAAERPRVSVLQEHDAWGGNLEGPGQIGRARGSRVLLRAAGIERRTHVRERFRAAIDRRQELHQQPPEQRYSEQVLVISAAGGPMRQVREHVIQCRRGSRGPPALRYTVQTPHPRAIVVIDPAVR